MLSVWAYEHFTIPGSVALQEIGFAALFFSLFAAGVYAVTPERPAIPRTYPYSGLVKELGGLEENKVLGFKCASILDSCLLRRLRRIP